MIDRHTETLLTIREAILCFPRQPRKSTLCRWYKTGSKGVILETIWFGGRIFTSKEAIDRFIQATTEVARKRNVQSTFRTPTEASRSKEKARKILERFGVRKAVSA